MVSLPHVIPGRQIPWNGLHHRIPATVILIHKSMYIVDPMSIHSQVEILISIRNGKNQLASQMKLIKNMLMHITDGSTGLSNRGGAGSGLELYN